MEGVLGEVEAMGGLETVDNLKTVDNLTIVNKLETLDKSELLDKLELLEKLERLNQLELVERLDKLELLDKLDVEDDFEIIGEEELLENLERMEHLELAEGVELIEELEELGEQVGAAEELRIMEMLGLMQGLEIIEEDDLLGKKVEEYVVYRSEEEENVALLKEKQKYINKYNKLVAFMVIVGIVLVTFVMIFSVSIFLFQDNLEGMAAENDQLLLQNILADMVHEEVADAFSEVAEALVEVSKVTSVINGENELLLEAVQSRDEIIQVYETREVLLDLYEYAIMDSAGKRTDIKYDDVIMLENLVEEKGMSEDVVSLILAIAMTESGGDESATNDTSTAVGLGQFLSGTGEFVYHRLMNGSNYQHEEMASNGTTNLTMMVHYIEYLDELYDGDVDRIINSYRGLDSTTYKARLNYFLAKSELSLNTIQMR